MAQNSDNTSESPRTHLDDEYSVGPIDKLINTCQRFKTLLCSLISIILFLFDVGSDIYLCVTYYREREFVYFALTLAFVAIPSLIMAGFSLRWYVKDYGVNQIDNENYKISRCRWTIIILGLVFQMGPIIRYVDTMYYCVKRWEKQSQEQKYYYKQMMRFEDNDICILNLLGCTLEAGPQLLLQLYILSTQGGDQSHVTMLIQAASCIFSLMSLALCVTSCKRAQRFAQEDKENMLRVPTAVHFLWQTFMAIPRVLALAMFASAFTYWVFVLIGTHWIVMTAWLIIQKTNFTKGTRCEETLFNVVMGAVYVLCYINVKDVRTRHYYTFYYLITYLENSGMILSWYFVKQSPRDWYYLPTVVVVLVAFFAGLLCMQVYYFCCHPTGNIQVCYSDGSTSSNVPSVAEPVLINPLMEQHELGRVGFAQPLVSSDRRPIQNNVTAGIGNGSHSSRREPTPTSLGARAQLSGDLSHGAALDQYGEYTGRSPGERRVENYCKQHRIEHGAYSDHSLKRQPRGEHLPYSTSAGSNMAAAFRKTNNSSPFCFQKTDEQMGSIEVGPLNDRYTSPDERYPPPDERYAPHVERYQNLNSPPVLATRRAAPRQALPSGYDAYVTCEPRHHKPYHKYDQYEISDSRHRSLYHNGVPHEGSTVV